MQNVRLDEAQTEILLGEISITSDMQMTLPLWQKVFEVELEPLDESEREEWKSWLKT